jgi:hypothetical protein
MAMKPAFRKRLLAILSLFISISTYSQCEILNKVSPDGSMQYYMQPVNFYWTKSKSLSGCIVTDKESYFLELLPIPFPEKPAGNKLKDDLELNLADGNAYKLKHFDTRYTENDTVMEMLYLIGKKDLEVVLNNEIIEAKMNMKGEEGIRTYVFKLHKAALKEQLACFLNETEKKKKK